MSSCTLWEGDCIDLMGDIKDGSIDLILCDLPYGTTACRWDTIIPFDALWRHYERIIKKAGAIVLTGSQPFTAKLICSNLKLFRYEWIWQKDSATGFLDARRKPLKSHENILVFSKSRTVYNPQMTPGKPYTAKMGKRGYSTTKDKNIQAGGYVTENKGVRFPKSVIQFNTERGLHPTQKPVTLMEYLIKTYTNEGDTVLDSCMGSGTTGVACLNTGRQFIGIENDPDYFVIAKNRLSQ